MEDEQTPGFGSDDEATKNVGAGLNALVELGARHEEGQGLLNPTYTYLLDSNGETPGCEPATPLGPVPRSL